MIGVHEFAKAQVPQGWSRPAPAGEALAPPALQSQSPSQSQLHLPPPPVLQSQSPRSSWEPRRRSRSRSPRGESQRNWDSPQPGC